MTPTVVHVDVNGVGYEVHISLHTYAQIQHLKEGILYTHLLVREDAHILYGFFDKGEKDLFLQLLSVSGVGASTARVMLSSLPPDELLKAILSGNEIALEKVKLGTLCTLLMLKKANQCGVFAHFVTAFFQFA